MLWDIQTIKKDPNQNNILKTIQWGIALTCGTPVTTFQITNYMPVCKI